MFKRTLFLFLVALLLCSVTADSFVGYPRTKDEEKIEAVLIGGIVQQIGPGNYEGLADWLKQHIEFDKNVPSETYWKYPLETYMDGKGVCKDYALIAMECLKAMGVKDVFILGVLNYQRTKGHAVTIFRKSKTGRWYFYSNDQLIAGPRDFKNLVACVSYESGYGIYPTYTLINKDMQLIYQNEEKDWGL